MTANFRVPDAIGILIGNKTIVMIKKAMKNIEFVTPTSVGVFLSTPAFLILYPSRHGEAVNSRSITTITNPNGTVDSHICSHSSAVHECVEQCNLCNVNPLIHCSG